MVFIHHSHTAVAAYHDLLRMLKDEALSDLRGTPTLKAVNGKSYWYDRYRLGTEIVDRYLGEDSDDLRARFDRTASAQSDTKAAGKERARLVRLLKSEGLLPSDVATGQILTAMGRSGVFRLGGTLVGTQAFRLYEGILGVRIGADAAAMTLDIDIASFERLSLALGDTVDPALPDVFSDFDFVPVPSLDRSSVWRWRSTNRQTLVEFLTPSFSDEEGIRDLPALGVQAQALHHLNYLIADPVDAALLYRSGALVRVPRPERFAVHKLIVADRRRDGDRDKARKDRMQAEFLIRFLAEEQPDLLADAMADARDRGTAWNRRIDASLAKMSEARDILKNLET